MKCYLIARTVSFLSMIGVPVGFIGLFFAYAQESAVYQSVFVSTILLSVIVALVATGVAMLICGKSHGLCSGEIGEETN